MAPNFLMLESNVRRLDANLDGRFWTRKDDMMKDGREENLR